MACFVETSSKMYRCSPTLSILQPESETVKRCSLSADCSDHRLCVRPSVNEELVRIGVWVPHANETSDEGDLSEMKFVIWSGPSEEILEEGVSYLYLLLPSSH